MNDVMKIAMGIVVGNALWKSLEHISWKIKIERFHYLQTHSNYYDDDYDDDEF